MLTLITGGSASGKSAFAENFSVLHRTGSLLYIATMMPFDDECRIRIARHREQRADKGFSTIECYTNLAAVTVLPHSTVLLECLSNLTANEQYAPDGVGADQAEEAILTGIHHLCMQASHVVVVSNEIFSDGVSYDESTQHYIQILGNLNRRLAAQADNVIEVVCGIPVIHKEANSHVAGF